MTKCETLYQGYEFYNNFDNRCVIKDKHFDTYECEEEVVDSPDGTAENVTYDRHYYTASEMRTMLHAKSIVWEDRSRWYAVMRDRECNDWGTGSFDKDEAIEMAQEQLDDYPETYIAVINEETGVCVDEIEVA